MTLAAPLDPSGCLAVVSSPRWSKRVAIFGECHIWTGDLAISGYGRVRVLGHSRLAHRVAYVAATGADVPGRLELDHLCRTHGCVNPDHLEPVSTRENALRGDTLIARNLAKTHCPHGHPLHPASIPSHAQRGWRGCTQCQRRHAAEQKRAISAAAAALGLKHRDYGRLYGWSKHQALAIVERMASA